MIGVGCKPVRHVRLMNSVHASQGTQRTRAGPLGQPTTVLMVQHSCRTSTCVRIPYRSTHRAARCMASGMDAMTSDTAQEHQEEEHDTVVLVTDSCTLPLEKDTRGNLRLVYKKEGYETWNWDSHKINWLRAGERGPIVLLIHGFGASVYHWRYIIPHLAQHCRVYALDCLGFGWSDKALVDYNGYGVWKKQISDFIREVIQTSYPDEKVVLVGNSLGGYNSLATAAEYPDLVESVVLLNAAGRFDLEYSAAAAEEKEEENSATVRVSSLMESIGAAIKRIVVGASFILAKQPVRVRQVLKQVYFSHDNVDDELVESILNPADDPNASEVFYRVITSRGTPVNALLDTLEQHDMPLFLLWGSKDPWCVPANATRIQYHYPSATRIDILSGHCPHDDTPEEVVRELVRWCKGDSDPSELEASMK